MKLRPDINPMTTFSFQNGDGSSGPPPATPNLGANVAIQYTVGVATKVPVTFIYTDEQNNDGLEGFIDLIAFILSQSSPPQVLTTSYGFNEDVVSNSLSKYVTLTKSG